MVKNSMSKFFAAFIMTYERPSTLCATVDKLLNQSLPPEKILIVDNSLSNSTEVAIGALDDPRIEYFRVGYNSGPSGAAAIGLTKLTEEGFEWIYWGDDDDPPKFDDSIELVMKSASETEQVGIVGAVGSHFNWSSGILKRLDDEELKGVVPVDVIAGGMVMIVNAAVIANGVLPDERFFFGFEELDFCSRTKSAGFKVVINGELAFRYRQSADRLNIRDKKDRYKGWKFNKSKSSLWREYYSIRNFCFMMLYKYKKPRIVFILLLRVIYKMIMGFQVYGPNGWLNIWILFLALKDASLKRMGRNDEIQRIIKP